jgi:hypothetical protein
LSLHNGIMSFTSNMHMDKLSETFLATFDDFFGIYCIYGLGFINIGGKQTWTTWTNSVSPKVSGTYFYVVVCNYIVLRKFGEFVESL